MSFFWGRFDPIEGEIDHEVKQLYRIRDNDNKHTKGFLVDMTTIAGYSLDSRNPQDMITQSVTVNTDPIWEAMTEEERIENGLTSKLQYKIMGPASVAIFPIITGKIIKKII